MERRTNNKVQVLLSLNMEVSNQWQWETVSPNDNIYSRESAQLDNLYVIQGNKDWQIVLHHLSHDLNNVARTDDTTMCHF